MIRMRMSSYSSCPANENKQYAGQIKTESLFPPDYKKAAMWFLKAQENGLDCTDELKRCGEDNIRMAILMQYCISERQSRNSIADALKKVKSNKQAEMLEANNIAKKTAIIKQISYIDTAIEYYSKEEDSEVAASERANKAANNIIQDLSSKSPDEEYDLALDYLSSSDDMEIGLNLLKDLAEKSYVPAMAKLGDMYHSGNRVRKDIDEAVKWTKLAAEAGDPNAQFDLAFMYGNGDGVEQDREESAYWMKESAKGGQPTAMLNTGSNYLNGYGLGVDHEKGASWIKKSAEKDEPRAMTALGWCYYQGTGIEHNIDKAEEWAKKALDLGDESARTLLQKISLVKNGF